MKNILKIASIIFVSAILFASCTTKKQNCDAYGSISKMEKAQELNKVQKSQIILSEKKS